MNDTQVSFLDYIILFFILLVSILIGIYHGFKSEIFAFLNRVFKKRNDNSSTDELELKDNQIGESNETLVKQDRVTDYLTGNASMGPLPISFSLLASFFSTNTVLGTPAEIYQYGIQNWIIGLGFAMPPIYGLIKT
jgi:hypothetical protein